MRFRLRLTHPPPVQALTVPRRIRLRRRPLRVLDFDIENRPLSYLGSDFTTAEITAIAWAWVDDPSQATCYLLDPTRGTDSAVEMLRAFVTVYDQADMVTGHYITGHDLPMLNGALTEYGLPALSDKMVHDTKVHLIKRKGMSGSQESLGAMLNLEHDKVKMDQAKWRDANRLTPKGRALARERVIGDVQQHIEMRAKLLELGYLAPPKLWKSGSAKLEAYTP